MMKFLWILPLWQIAGAQLLNSRTSGNVLGGDGTTSRVKQQEATMRALSSESKAKEVEFNIQLDEEDVLHQSQKSPLMNVLVQRSQKKRQSWASRAKEQMYEREGIVFRRRRPRTAVQKLQEFVDGNLKKTNKSFKELSYEKRHLQIDQNIGGVLVFAMDACKQDALAMESDKEKKYSCSCSENSLGNVLMNCRSNCGHYCNKMGNFQRLAGDICGLEEYDHLYEMDGTPFTKAERFIYTKGETGTLSIVQENCSREDDAAVDNLLCSTCFVDIGTTQKCRSCEIITCDDGRQAPLIDCGNIEQNTLFNLCEPGSVPFRDGIFSKLSSMNFEECTDESPPNDVCDDNSEIMPIGRSKILGVTDQAMSDEVETCSGSFSATPGLWYRVQGQGSGIVASTCGEETTFDTQISIYKGSCDNLECINTNDDATRIGCGFGHSSVSWFGQLGIEYHIRVHGFDSATGTFELSIDEVDLALDGCTATKSRYEAVAPRNNEICSCETIDSAGQSLACNNLCTYCNQEETVCSTKTFSALFDNKAISHFQTTSYLYTKGRSEYVEIKESNCTLDKCEECTVSIDGKTCQSCNFTSCVDGEGTVYDTGISIDCSNLGINATFNQCEAESASNDGVFQFLSDESFQTCNQAPADACDVLAKKFEQSTGLESTSCSCKDVSDESATMICMDDNCRFCNIEADVCANITYGGTVTVSGGLDITFREYNYVQGRTELLRYEEDSDGKCSFFIDGIKCSSCQRVTCSGPLQDFEGSNVDCTNIDPNATFSECDFNRVIIDTGIFEVFSHEEFEHCVEGEDPNEVCLRTKAYEENHGIFRNTTCECSANPITGVHTLTCSDNGCLFCNHLATVCATNIFGYTFNSFGQYVSFFSGYDYIPEFGGRTDRVITEYLSGECTVKVDNQVCSSCEVSLCVDDTYNQLFQDIRVDCENIEEGASFDGCDRVYIDTGVLEVASDNEFHQCIVPQDPREACLAEATTQEMERDGTKCECKPNDHGGYKLFCVEKGCLYCNTERDACGYDTFGMSFNSLGHPIGASNGFQYLSGGNGNLTFYPVSDPSDPRDCSVWVDDMECSSCSVIQCDSLSDGVRVECDNLEGGSVFDPCENEDVEGMLEYFSPYSFLQCMKTSDPMDFCQDQKYFTELTKSKHGTVCNCEEDSDAVKLSCTDTQCMYCSSDSSICKLDVLYGGIISEFGFYVQEYDVSHFMEAQTERLTIERSPSGACSVYIDGDRCSSCKPEECDDETVGLNIDCENVIEGAMHKACSKDHGDGVFLSLTDSSFSVCLAYDGTMPPATAPLSPENRKDILNSASKRFSEWKVTGHVLILLLCALAISF